MFAFTWPLELILAAQSRGWLPFHFPSFLGLFVGFRIRFRGRDRFSHGRRQEGCGRTSRSAADMASRLAVVRVGASGTGRLFSGCDRRACFAGWCAT